MSFNAYLVTSNVGGLSIPQIAKQWRFVRSVLMCFVMSLAIPVIAKPVESKVEGTVTHSQPKKWPKLYLEGPHIISGQLDEETLSVEFSLHASANEGIELNKWTDEAPRYTVMKLDNPLRVIVDVIGADVSKLTTPIEPLKGPISQIGALQLGQDNHKIGRLIFTLTSQLEHRVMVKDDRLSFVVTLSQPAKHLAQDKTVTSTEAPLPSLQAQPTQTQSMWRVKSFAVKASTPSPLDETNEVGQTVQVILAPNDQGVSLPTPYVDESNSMEPHLLLQGLRVPKHFERRLDSRVLDGPLKYISLLREEDDLGRSTGHLIAELRHDASYQVHFVQSNDDEYILEWTFRSVAKASSQLAQSMSNGVATSQNRAPTFKSEQSRTPRTSTTQRRKKRYLGKRIKINIKDADIHNVLRFLADCGQVNIVTSDEVEGKVTLMLNQVPWDQALDIILRSKGLDMVREGNIIRIAPREAIAAERKAELEKTQIKEQLKPIMIRLITVNHAEGKDMVEQVKGVLSERGSVSFDLRTNTLIIKDIEEHIEAAEDLVKRLDTQTPQVLIEARIVEVNKVNEKELGIQWGGSFNGIVGTGNATGLSFPSSVGLKGAADDIQFQPPGVPAQPNFMINLPATVGVGSGGAVGLSLGSVDGAFNLNVRLSAAANRGTVKIVSSPKITTLDNKRALISQGVSIPISQVSAQGVQTVFFDATLSLEVTPHVTQDGNIYLQLKANNDTPDFQNVGSRGDPTILKKEASTQVLLQDGETTVIGGIYTSNAGYGSTEWPFLSQIPIIGVLFRKTSERSQKNELLIFITPRVINRLASRVNTR
jgi:type IV pilus assembly protein PilQ